MKRHLHLYQWLLCLLLTVSGNVMAEKVTSLDDLKAGSVIQIYPHKYGGYQLYALACNGNENELTSFENAGKGYLWTIEDAGDGYYYLKNELGCYWAYQGVSSRGSLRCTTDVASAVKIKFTYDDTYQGVCFWNAVDQKGLNNLNSSNNSYNWWSDATNYSGDSNTTFDVYIGSCDSYEFVTVDGFKYSLNLTQKSAKVIANNYKGDIVVPQYVNYKNTDYAITSADFSAFTNCTSIDARYCSGVIGAGAFEGCENLTSVILGNVESIGYSAFGYCSNLTSVTMGNVGNIGELTFQQCNNLTSVTLGNVDSISKWAFYWCGNLTSVTLGNVGSIGEVAFQECNNLTSVTLGNVGSIGKLAFAESGNLTSVTLGNVESIGEFAFCNCRNLQSFIFSSGLKYLGNYAFYDCSSLVIKCYVENPEDIKVDEGFSLDCKRLYVLRSSLDDYKNTKPWSDMSDRIYPMGEIPITKITLLETAYIKDKGEEGKIQLLPTIEPEDADIKTLEWSSSDTNIATVDQDGNVTGVNYGDAIITATAMDGSEVSASCKVTVGTLDVESLSFEGMPSELIVGEYVENVTGKVKVHPEGADYTSIKIESSDATILRYYNTDKLLAKQPGTAMVTATATLPDGSTVSTSCDITVKADPTGVDQVTSDAASVHVNGNVLTISGLASDVPISVSSVQGYLVYQGTEHTCTLPGAGIYIVKVQGRMMKVTVR